MTAAKTSIDRRCRGRPQLRPDDETRQIIYEAARQEFAANGYAATSTEAVARRAGISTKTLYRLVPNKAALFEGMIADRLERFVAEVLPENSAMRKIFSKFGFQPGSGTSPLVIHLVLRL